MNLGGASQGYLAFDAAQQQRAKDALQAQMQQAQLAQLLQQQSAQQSAIAARQKWGTVLQGMLGGQQTPGGLPPPPGTPQGGPMPPGPGVSSAPPQGAPQGPQMGPGTLPPPLGAGADVSRGTPPAGPPAQAGPPLPPPPFKPMPTTPPAAPGGGLPPPISAAPPGLKMPQQGQGQQFGLQQIIGALKQSNIPPEKWADMLDTMPEPVKNNAAQEIKALKDQQTFLLGWANAQTRAAGETRKGEQGDRRLDQGDRKLDQGEDKNATAKALAEAKIKYMEAGGSAQFDETDKQYWSEVLKSGGTLPPGLARDPAGRKFVQELMRDVSHGQVSPKDMMGNQAEFQGLKAGERTLGTRSANIEMAATEAASLADLAKAASEKVSRSGFKGINDIAQAAQKKGSNPELRAFVASNTSLINAYARAINPQGVGTVADKEHARDMLDTAFSKGDYAATVDQLLLEIKAAQASPGTVKKEMRERFTGTGGHKEAPAEAITYLKAHPELAGEFSKKYGYLPAGTRGQ